MEEGGVGGALKWYWTSSEILSLDLEVETRMNLRDP